MANTSSPAERPICTNADCSELLKGSKDRSIFGQETHGTEDRELSRSGRRHLDEEGHMSDDEKHRCESGDTGLRPNSRWVKRLRLQSMDDSFALGTKSYEIEEPRASGGAHKVFTRMPPDHGKSKRDVPLRQCLEQHHSGKSIPLSGTEESPVEELKNSAWIRRWCHDCGEKVSSEGRQRRGGRQLREMGKHLPSVTAMALMGKMVGRYRTCEFKRRGPAVVWMI